MKTVSFENGENRYGNISGLVFYKIQISRVDAKPW